MADLSNSKFGFFYWAKYIELFTKLNVYHNIVSKKKKHFIQILNFFHYL